MNTWSILLSSALAALPLFAALYMWRSGDAREERPIFWGFIALAAFAVGAVLSETVLLVLGALFFSVVVLLGIISAISRAIRATREME